LIPSFFDHLNYYGEVTSCRGEPGSNNTFVDKLIQSFEENLETFEGYFTAVINDIEELAADMDSNNSL